MDILINGRVAPRAENPPLEVYNPYDGKQVGKLWKAVPDDAPGILQAAAEGFTAWSGASLSERAETLCFYADLLEGSMERLAALQCSEMGKTVTECTEELQDAVYATRGYVERAKHLYGKTFGDNQPGLESDLLFTRREPLGVMLCVVPFNFPAELFTHKVIPALAMGNAVILKVPDENPLLLAEMVKLLVEAGVPKKAAGVLCCAPEFSTQHIIQSDGIRAVSFTGSSKAGAKVMEAAAGRLHKVFLELGGNDAMIVFADADLDAAVEEIIEGRVASAGQNCCASKRFLVQQKAVEPLVEKLTARLKTLKTGNPADKATQIGLIASEERAKTVEGQIRRTVEQGATLAYGGVREGCFVQPTVLTGITRDMDIAGDMEVFGPVIPVIPFSDKEEALDIANGTPYGLQAGIMSGDLLLAMEVASKLRCGAVVINGTGNYRHAEMPFGGSRRTGIGREGVSATLEEFSGEKTYIVRGAFP